MVNLICDRQMEYITDAMFAFFIASRAESKLIGLLQLTITWYKSAMLEGKLIIIPALGRQNKGKASFTGSGVFVLMSQCGNNNELALQHGGFCTT